MEVSIISITWWEIPLQNIWTEVDKPSLQSTAIAINSCLATHVLANKLTARNPGEGWPTHMKTSKMEISP